MSSVKTVRGLFFHTLGRILVGPNPPYPNCAADMNGLGDTDDDYGYFGLSSRHPGGCNVLMADGSARFLKNSVNQVTLWGLGSRGPGRGDQLRSVLTRSMWRDMVIGNASRGGSTHPWDPFHDADLLIRSGMLGRAIAAGPPPSPAVAAESEGTRSEGKRLKMIVTGGHPGDPEYGCGGTVARYTDLGHEVFLLYLNKGEWPPKAEGAGRIAEAKAACEILKARPLYAGKSTARRSWTRPLRGVPQDPGGRESRRRLHPLADRQPRRPSRDLDAGL